MISPGNTEHKKCIVVEFIIGPYLGGFLQMSYGYNVAIVLGGLVAFFVGDAQKMYKGS